MIHGSFHRSISNRTIHFSPHPHLILIVIFVLAALSRQQGSPRICSQFVPVHVAEGVLGSSINFMTAPPPQIKAFVGTIKAAYLDGDDSNSKRSPSDLFEGLVKMELALRGVLVQEESKLWSQVQSAIGKPLLENLPPPLWAGATVVAGRLAEALWAALKDDDNDKSTSASFQYSVDAPILQRAKDIHDIRWMLLLQQQVSFLEIARGYFCKAASIQTETPPMWKKVWDVWTTTLRQSSGGGGGGGNRTAGEDETAAAIATPFEAQVAIENLTRIAAAKGNAKRVVELQVRLVCSYLNSKQGQERLPIVTTRIGKEDVVVAQAFGDDVTAKLPSDPSIIVEKAQQVLEECDATELSEADRRLLPALSVRIGVALEEAKVEEMAQQQHQTNQNRSVSSSLETCRTKSRHKLFLHDEDPLHDAALALRDSVVSLWGETDKDDDDSYWLPSLESINQCIGRLRDRALAKIQKDTSRDQGWRILLEFLSPLLQSLQGVSGWSVNHERKERMQHLLEHFSSTSQEERNTISLVALTSTKVYWMLLTNGIDTPMEVSLKFVLDLLSVLIQHGIPKESQVPAAVGATSTQSPLNRQWKLARSLVICGIAQGNQVIIDQVSMEAVATKKQSDEALGVLQGLVSWSGWYQRPWSYCSNLSDVRRLLAATKLTGERCFGVLECILLDLARADAELLNGGFPKQSQELYTQVLDTLDNSANLRLDDVALTILQGHCYNGLARACQIDENVGQLTKVQDLAQKTLDLLDGIVVPEEIKPLHIWYDHSLFLFAISHQRSVARQLIADSSISQGRTEEARSFLEAAVQDAPLDAGAALAFGAFLFRVAFYLDDERSPDAAKAAQIQLLKAAKLDPSKADPFSLLGLWFEECGDPDRALGCFTKGLALDPCNPIAGRGLLRLKTREEMVAELDTAIGINSPICGWAWRGIGLNKIFLEAEDEFAIVALLKALRSRDVSAPGNETLGIFYHRPGAEYVNERADALAELAMCYRRLGRFTASLRAFHAAIVSAGEHIASSVLCSCAQVELELSMFDQAVEKFGRVLLREEGSSHAIAAYGQGVALHYIAQRDLEDGKAGSAMSHIQRAIQYCENFSFSFGCTRKLLGDLYSFGALLPPDLFADNSEEEVAETISKQLQFVRKGEKAYRSVREVQSEDSSLLKAQATCDVGSNILLQAQLLEVPTQGLKESVPEINNLYDRSRQEFQTSLELDPLYAPAWCGLGCSVLSSDPLLAQHAFSRCIQIEQMFPDAYANIGFLYTSKKAFRPSDSVMNALTQVADTPMMWMNRAFILERDAKKCLTSDGDKAASNLSQASDAYRAAMQVMKHPESQLGLAMTSRVVSTKTRGAQGWNLVDSQLRKDSLSHTREYRGGSMRFHDTLSLLEGVMSIEQAFEVSESSSWSKDLLKEAESLILKGRGAEHLNADSIKDQQGIGAERVVQEEASKGGTRFPLAVGLQRQILHEPDRADLWLALARELTSSATGPSSIDSAGAAAARAANMLTEELIHPRVGNGRFPSFVSAPMLSDALALTYWLRHNASLSDQKVEEAKDDRMAASGTDASSFGLQRALMMDPTNAIAREALHFVS